jgi:hypothetical protein
MSDETFMSLALNGYVLPDEVEDFIEAWHASDSNLEVHEYLGMHFSEYSLWVSDPDSINIIIAARHSGISLRQAVNDNLRSTERIAARADEARKLSVLARWIESQPDR